MTTLQDRWYYHFRGKGKSSFSVLENEPGLSDSRTHMLIILVLKVSPGFGSIVQCKYCVSHTLGLMLFATIMNTYYI